MEDKSITNSHNELNRIRLDFLDGMRGFAALYVLLYHIQQYYPISMKLPIYVYMITKLFMFGTYAVAVFIVLSGFVLMLPVIKSENHSIKGGPFNFIYRRFRRIFPPYYAALIISLIIIYLFPHLAWGGFSRTSLIAHIFMVHNLNLEWQYGIDPTMWSVATEWDIYFIFILLLLPIWKRFGNVILLISAFIFSLLPHFLFHGKIDWAAPQYILLFSLGMLGAVISYDTNIKMKKINQNTPWKILSFLFFILFIVYMALSKHIRSIGDVHLWFPDIFIGIATVSIILHILVTLQEGSHSKIIRILSSKYSILLGVFSYSLYLTHMCVIPPLHSYLISRHIPNLLSLILMYVIGAPVALAFGYAFHLIFERPFLPVHYKQQITK